MSVGKQHCFQLQGAILWLVWGEITGPAVNTSGLHAAGAQCPGSETAPYSRPARQQSRGRRVLRFFELPVDALQKGADAQSTQGHPASPALLMEATHRCGSKEKSGRHPRQRTLA